MAAARVYFSGRGRSRRWSSSGDTVPSPKFASLRFANFDPAVNGRVIRSSAAPRETYSARRNAIDDSQPSSDAIRTVARPYGKGFSCAKLKSRRSSPV